MWTNNTVSTLPYNKLVNSPFPSYPTELNYKYLPRNIRNDNVSKQNFIPYKIKKSFYKYTYIFTF